MQPPLSTWEPYFKKSMPLLTELSLARQLLKRGRFYSPWHTHRFSPAVSSSSRPYPRSIVYSDQGCFWCSLDDPLTITPSCCSSSWMREYGSPPDLPDRVYQLKVWSKLQAHQDLVNLGKTARLTSRCPLPSSQWVVVLKNSYPNWLHSRGKVKQRVVCATRI